MLVGPAAPAQTASSAAPANSDYVLGEGDVVEVEVLGQSDFGKPRVKIKSDGTIVLPVVGTLPVANQTAPQVSSTVRQKLVDAQYYKDPVVNVEVVGFASRYVIVLGAVAQPGLVPIDRAYRVSEILARVGGVRDTGADHVILSSVNGAERKIAVAGLARNGPSDPYGDKLFIPDAEVFYIYGQVNAPGAYPLKERMTLRQALARGGGLTASGSEKRLKLYRNSKELRLGLDTRLEPGDVVAVGERLF